MRVGEENRTEAKLEIRQRSVQDLYGEKAPVGSALEKREARGRLDRDLTVSDWVGIFQAKRPAFIEIPVVDRFGDSHRRAEHEKRCGDDSSHHSTLRQCLCSESGGRRSGCG